MEYRNLTESKLKVRVAELNAALKVMQFDLKTGAQLDLKAYRKAKKDLAQAQTVMNEKKLGINADLKVEVKPVKVEAKTVKTKEAKSDKLEDDKKSESSKSKKTK